MRLTYLLFLPLLLTHPGTARAQVFEAVSLHPLARGATPSGDAAFAALDPSRPPGDPAPSLLSIDASVADLVVAAFGIRDSGLQPALLKQLPDWAQAEPVHLTARLPAGATIAQMRIMLQVLLRERFAFASHEETKPSPVLLLQADPKQALRLVQHTQECTHQARCGTDMKASPGSITVHFTSATLTEIAAELGGYAWYWGGLRYGPVVNGTALQGRYDGSFTFAPLMKADVEGGPTLQEGLRHDLGLTLQKSTRPLSQRIIDHIARPTFD